MIQILDEQYTYIALAIFAVIAIILFIFARWIKDDDWDDMFNDYGN